MTKVENKGWIITRDYLGDRLGYNENLGVIYKVDNVEIIGPHGCKLTKEEIISNGHPFQMFDDDGELYYEGFLLADNSSDEGFWPLEHYGEPNAGCTTIKYLNYETNQWVEL